MPNAPEASKAAAAAIGKQNFEKVLAATNCCVIVDSRNEADVVIDGMIYGEGNPAAMIPAFITGLSLYTIPSWVTGKPHVSASVKQGETVREYDFRDEMTMVQWLPLILAMPFREHPLTMARRCGGKCLPQSGRRHEEGRQPAIIHGRICHVKRGAFRRPFSLTRHSGWHTQAEKQPQLRPQLHPGRALHPCAQLPAHPRNCRRAMPLAATPGRLWQAARHSSSSLVTSALPICAGNVTTACSNWSSNCSSRLSSRRSRLSSTAADTCVGAASQASNCCQKRRLS